MATKRLARQLGLIRRKSVSPASGNPGGSRLKQLYDYLIVIDFESTCWKDGKHHNSPEIIEFPAVLLSTATGEIESEFHAYVQPQEHPVLSEFCTELTGIKQVQVDEGVPLKICLSQFCKWIHKIQQQKKIILATGDSEPSTEVKLCAFLTWSDWDLGVCLEYECRRKQLLKPVFLNSWIDLRATYKLFYKRKPKGLSGALQEVGIEFSGREHSGLDDSRNTALLAWKMIRDGCLMKITRSLNKVLTKKNPKILVKNLSTDQVEETSTYNISIEGPSIYQKESKSTVNTQENAQMNLASVNSSIKDQLQPKTNTKADRHNIKRCFPLFTTKPSTSMEQLCSPTLNPPLSMQKQRKNTQLVLNDKSKSSALNSNLVLVSTTIPSVNVVSDGGVGCTFDCLPMLAEWEDVVLLPSSQAEKDKDCVPPISDTNVDTSFNSGESVMVLKEPEILSYENFEDLKETPQNFETSKSIVYKSPHSTVYNVKGAKHPGSDASAFKLPECKPFTSNSLNANASHPSVLRKQSLLLGGTKRYSCSPPAFPQAKKQTFTVHEEKSTASTCSPGTSSLKVLPSILTSTVNLQEPWERGKMTPPLCKCGRRSKRLIVSNNGPNHGKAFYCCPVGKHQDDRKCCGYFKWEQTLQKERANSKALSRSSEGLTFNSPETSHIYERKLSFPIKNSLQLRPSMRN
ncbi:ERI1 exoribonuclease 2 isoform X1 [Mesocricetus auratus]|uniref:ERI1 exoribonuclease 2 isoform X1 n=2 Tax=Mesocricetus auratus TaxID=10036 RepID=A0ABM2Y985_MESAU|nr:ERI1 exoribonuclease 2 isoform X1 [Mesocricetus auratus]